MKVHHLFTLILIVTLCIPTFAQEWENSEWMSTTGFIIKVKITKSGKAGRRDATVTVRNSAGKKRQYPAEVWQKRNLDFQPRPGLRLSFQLRKTSSEAVLMFPRQVAGLTWLRTDSGTPVQLPIPGKEKQEDWYLKGKKVHFRYDDKHIALTRFEVQDLFGPWIEYGKSFDTRFYRGVIESDKITLFEKSKPDYLPWRKVLARTSEASVEAAKTLEPPKASDHKSNQPSPDLKAQPSDPIEAEPKGRLPKEPPGPAPKPAPAPEDIFETP